MNIFCRSVRILVILAALDGACFGVEIRAVFRNFVSQPPVQNVARLFISGQDLRIDTTPFTGEISDLRYRRGYNAIRYVNHSQATYMDLDEKKLAGFGDKVGATMAYFKDKVAWIKGEEPESPAPLTVTPEDGTWNLQDFPCRKYSVYRGQAKIQEVWATDWSRAKIAPSEFDVLRKLAMSYDRMSASLAMIPILKGIALIPIEGINQVEGYPVLIRQYGGGKLTYEIVLGAPASATLPSDLFTLPPGYEKGWF